MGRFFQWLFGGCAHHWTTLDTGKVMDSKIVLPVGRWYDQECKKCGKRRYYQDF